MQLKVLTRKSNEKQLRVHKIKGKKTDQIKRREMLEQQPFILIIKTKNREYDAVTHGS